MLDLHENQIEEAKKHAKHALVISRTYHSTNHCYLLSKLKYLESAVARREGNYAQAKELLDDSIEVREGPYCYLALRPNRCSFLYFVNHVRYIRTNIHTYAFCLSKHLYFSFIFHLCSFFQLCINE